MSDSLSHEPHPLQQSPLVSELSSSVDMTLHEDLKSQLHEAQQLVTSLQAGNQSVSKVSCESRSVKIEELLSQNENLKSEIEKSQKELRTSRSQIDELFGENTSLSQELPEPYVLFFKRCSAIIPLLQVSFHEFNPWSSCGKYSPPRI